MPRSTWSTRKPGRPRLGVHTHPQGSRASAKPISGSKASRLGERRGTGSAAERDDAEEARKATRARAVIRRRGTGVLWRHGFGLRASQESCVGEQACLWVWRPCYRREEELLTLGLQQAEEAVAAGAQTQSSLWS